MAVHSDPTAHTPKSTGAVKFDGAEVTTEQTADAASTDAVKYASPGETKAEHWDADVTVVAPTAGPTTMSVSWLPEAKVVAAPTKSAPKKSGANVTTKGQG